MRFKLKYAALAVACMAAMPAQATNGYFLPGVGFRSQGMGGVGIAYGTDSLSIGANPANIVNTGMRGDMGFAVFNPERHAAVGRGTGQPGGDSFPGGGSNFFFNGNTESDLKYFVMPEMGMTMNLTEDLHVGFAVVANGGMNTSYPENFFTAFGVPPKDSKIGVDMMQVIVPITVGYKVNENHAVGVSLNLAETRFRAYGLEAFANFPNVPSNSAYVTGNGFDYSYGAGLRLGWLGNYMNDRVSVGLTYSSRTFMSKFDKYKSLFAEGGDFDIPENYGIGVAFKPQKNLVVAAEIVRINYNDVKSIGNRGPGNNPGLNTNGVPSLNQNDPDRALKQLGLAQGMGFGWDNQTVYKIGVQYGVNKRLQVRSGFNYGKSPIPDDQITFNLLAPATVEKHYSVGFTYKASEELEVTGTYMYAASNSQQNCNQNIIDCAAFNMHQNVFALSLGWVLDPGMTGYGDGPMDPINFAGWYAGFGAGRVSSNNWSSAFDSKLGSLGFTSSTDADSSDLGIKVFTGFQFNKYFALEGGYAEFNNMVAKSTISAPSAGSLYTTAQNDTWTLAAVGTLPLTRDIAVFAKVGANNWSSNQRSTGAKGSAKNSPADIDIVKRGTDLFYGLGVSYALLDNVDLRGEVERYDFGGLNVNYLSGGLALKF